MKKFKTRIVGVLTSAILLSLLILCFSFGIGAEEVSAPDSEPAETSTGEAADTLATEYGAIPEDNASASVVVFGATTDADTGAVSYTFLEGYDTFANAAAAVGLAKDSTSAFEVKKYIILLRTGYTHSTPLQVDCFTSEYVIDLGGNTIAVTAGKGFLQLYSTSTDALTAGNVVIKNGTFTLAGGSSTSVLRPDTKRSGTYSIDFEDVTIKALQVDFAAISTAGACPNTMTVSSKFTNCVFDFTDGTPKNSYGCYMFGSGNKGIIEATIVDCDIIGAAHSNFQLVSSSSLKTAYGLAYYPGYTTGGSNDDVIYGEGNKLLLTENADTPEATTLNLGFAYSKTEGGYDVYDIVEKHTYGNILAEYTYTDKYPILLFKEDKTFVGGYDKFFAAASAAGLIGGGDDTDYVILFRRDFDNEETSGNITDYYNNVTIDLGGFNVKTTSIFLYLYSGASLKDPGKANSKNEVSFGTITVKNGSFDLAATGNATSIVRLTGKAATTGTPLYATFPIDFEGVTFATSAGAQLVVASTAANSSNKGIHINTVDITLTDCRFDFGTSEVCYMFGSGNNRIINATVKGGEIIASGNSAFALNDSATIDSCAFTFYAKPFDDTVTFAKNGDGEYTKLTLKEGVTLPDYTVNGGELTFIKNATGEGTVTYTLVPTSATQNFTPEANITLDSNLIFNIYLPTTKSVVALALNGEEREIKVEDGYYVISESLKPYEAAKTLTLEVTIEVEGTKLKGTFTFSVADYANTIISGEGYSTAEQALAKDMLSYVRACYNFFVEANNASYKDYNTAEEIARVNGIIDGIIGEDTAYVPTGTAKTPESGSGFSAVTFYLGDAPAFRFYYTSASAPAYSYKIGNYEIPESDIVMDTDTNGNYVEIKVYAYQLISDLTFTDGNKTYTYNVYSYYAQASEAAKTLVGRLIKYSESAKNYRDSVIDPQA